MKTREIEKATAQKRAVVRMPPELFNEVLAEAKITHSSINEIIKRRLMICYGLIPKPVGEK